MNENILIAILAELKRIADSNEAIAEAKQEHNALLCQDLHISEMQSELEFLEGLDLDSEVN